MCGGVVCVLVLSTHYGGVGAWHMYHRDHGAGVVQ